MLDGAIDLHVHGYPELKIGYGEGLDDVRMARRAKKKGLGGYVLKSHVWPTMDRVYHIRRRVKGIGIEGGIVLNSLLGGVSPGVVEMAVAQGAKAVWFPTWSSANDLRRGGFSKLVRDVLPGLDPFMGQGLTVIDDWGRLTAEARDVLAVAKSGGVMVGTGHLSPAEALALAGEAERIGFNRLVFTHPDSNSVGASEGEILEAAKRGAYIEWCFNAVSPTSQRMKAQRVVEWINVLGADRCVLSTDIFGRAPLLEPDLFQFFVGTLHNLGLSDAQVKTMVVENPRLILYGEVRESPGVRQDAAPGGLRVR